MIDLDSVDLSIARFMQRWGVRALQIALAIVFVWFGILKPLGLSPAEPLLLATVERLPFFSPRTWLIIIGWWEVVIGVLFLFHGTIRIAIALLAGQMVGTFMPLVVLPDMTFQPGRFPYGLTLAGQYIVKNLLILGAALVVGGTVRPRREIGIDSPSGRNR
jgi:uncharacterized membrane protein YkgB